MCVCGFFVNLQRISKSLSLNFSLCLLFLGCLNMSCKPVVLSSASLLSHYLVVLVLQVRKVFYLYVCVCGCVCLSLRVYATRSLSNSFAVCCLLVCAITFLLLHLKNRTIVEKLFMCYIACKKNKNKLLVLP